MGIRQKSRGGVLALAALSLLILIAVAGCGARTSNAGTPSLRCTVQSEPSGVDVLATKLTCNVSSAASNEVSFTLRYTLIADDGTRRAFGATCDGALHDGAGDCTQIYKVIVPLSPASASVDGELLPDHRALGPVAPTAVP
ncbi:MAG: hypothetical protein OJF49_000764 [Ktedonobacterales bacterium]|jgi:hypothetical protein|nr:MAG: hypothetical protein OJF49_000764 [Ktedonobacterales bacterium]